MNKYQIATFAVITGFIFLSSFQIDRPTGLTADSGEVYPTGTMEYMFTMRALGTVFPTRTKSATATDSPTPTDIAAALPPADSNQSVLKLSSPGVNKAYREIVTGQNLNSPGVWFSNDILGTNIWYDEQPVYVDTKSRTLYTRGVLYAPGVQQEFIDTLMRDGYGKVRYIFRSPSGNRMLIYRDSQTHPDTYTPWPYDLWLWEKGKGFSVLFTGYSWIHTPGLFPQDAAWSADESLFFIAYTQHSEGSLECLVNLKDHTTREIFSDNDDDSSDLKNIFSSWPINFKVSTDGKLAAYDRYDPYAETSSIAVVSVDELEPMYKADRSFPSALHVIPRRTLNESSGELQGAFDNNPIAWGPDHSRLYFSDTQENDKWAVFMYDLQTEKKSIWMTLNDLEAVFGQKVKYMDLPVFSPDGKKFAIQVNGALHIFEETDF